MPRRLIEEKEISITEAKSILEREKDELGEFQRRTLDYLSKFSKIDDAKAKRLVKELVSSFNLGRREAIQVVNCMPATISELRSILSVKGKIVLTSHLYEILKKIGEARSK